ncbi:MAG: hypothetical protein VKI81_03730 [Synechococcaceae cyanobacterium]|nr:hypothetical protein [Synechococcaceae cyanobacterium]
MQLQARLVHAEPGRRVVLVRACREGAVLGSALGEAATAEEAEDRALARLQRRLTDREAGSPPPAPAPAAESGSRSASAPPPAPAPSAAPSAPAEASAEAPPSAAEAAAEPPPDPEDWSSELAQLDQQLRRLGWSRDQEGTFLQRAFGHPSRSRLTTYADLVSLLRALERLEPGSDPVTAEVPLRRRDLLLQCDQLLERLGWNADRGREFLQRQLGAASRQELSDSQLLEFNMLLEGEMLAQG